MAIKSKPFLLRGIVKIQCFLKCFIARWPFGKEGGVGKDEGLAWGQDGPDAIVASPVPWANLLSISSIFFCIDSALCAILKFNAEPRKHHSRDQGAVVTAVNSLWCHFSLNANRLFPQQTSTEDKARCFPIFHVSFCVNGSIVGFPLFSLLSFSFDNEARWGTVPEKASRSRMSRGNVACLGRKREEPLGCFCWSRLGRSGCQMKRPSHSSPRGPYRELGQSSPLASPGSFPASVEGCRPSGPDSLKRLNHKNTTEMDEEQNRWC